MSGADIEYVVNLHVHTEYSDGSGRVDQVIKAARKAGLDVLIVSDHDTMKAREHGHEGYQGDLLVLVGVEISGPHNHYLAFGPRTAPQYRWQDPQEFIDRVKEEGGVGFIAHPHEKGSPLSEGGRAFTWEDWSVNGFDGLEIWNHTSAWKTKARTWPRALYHYIFRAGTLQGPDRKTLDVWDELGGARRVAGVGGSDAHAFPARLLGLVKLKIFPYEYSFKAINTHLLLENPLTGDIRNDRAAVLNALAGGNCFVAHDKLGRAEGFRFRLENSGEVRAVQGEEVELLEGDSLVWQLPARADARLLRNGDLILSMTAEVGRFALNTPGVYRLEVDRQTKFFGARPWIFSNPIYVRPMK